jgi:putative serine protease PepD
MTVSLAKIASSVAAVLVVGAAGAAGASAWRAQIQDAQALASQARTIAHLQAELHGLEVRAARPDWPAIASTTEPSVLTISTDGDLGSGWVARSDAGGSDIVTNFHVVEGEVSAGAVTVEVRQFDRTMEGTIARIDREDDLALVHVSDRLAPLVTAMSRPGVGTTVMAIGSPLGLGGTVSIGVVSGFRSLGGSDYLQFSAPISPGNSGGPVVDDFGRVVGIATAKAVGDGVEALGFAIPVQTACAALAICVQA